MSSLELVGSLNMCVSCQSVSVTSVLENSVIYWHNDLLVCFWVWPMVFKHKFHICPPKENFSAGSWTVPKKVKYIVHFFPLFFFCPQMFIWLLWLIVCFSILLLIMMFSGTVLYQLKIHSFFFVCWWLGGNWGVWSVSPPLLTYIFYYPKCKWLMCFYFNPFFLFSQKKEQLLKEEVNFSFLP